MSHYDNVQTSKMSQSEIHKFLNRKLYESFFKSYRSLRKIGYFENALLRRMFHFAIDHFEKESLLIRITMKNSSNLRRSVSEWRFPKWSIAKWPICRSELLFQFWSYSECPLTGPMHWPRITPNCVGFRPIS